VDLSNLFLLSIGKFDAAESECPGSTMSAELAIMRPVMTHLFL